MPFNQCVPRPSTFRAIHAYAPMASDVKGISTAREWIYIGETDNLRGKLLSHLQDLDTSVMRLQPTGIVFEVCESVLDSKNLNRGAKCNSF